MANSREYQRAKARQEGYIAAKQGKPDTANPYIECDEWNHDGAYHFAWDRGWNEGAEEMNASKNKPELGKDLQWNKGDDMSLMKNPNAKNMMMGDPPMMEAQIGDPVYVKNYRCADGTMWSGWGILTSYPDKDELRRYTVVAPIGGRPCAVTVKEIYLEKPLSENKEVNIVCDDGHTMRLSYGEYDDEGGRRFIFGIDTPFETVSFAMNDLKPLIEGIRKLYTAS